MNLRLHQFVRQSTTNGPGARCVLWTRGCSFNCLGCFNPETHSKHGGFHLDTADLAETINRLPVRGVTLSGGEPLLQAEALLLLLEELRPDLDILLYSGFALEEAITSPARRNLLRRCDAALLGRYNNNNPHPYNSKELLITSGRIAPTELQPKRAVEIIVQSTFLVETGFPGV